MMRWAAIGANTQNNVRSDVSESKKSLNIIERVSQ
jgi:hypothetical protein